MFRSMKCSVALALAWIGINPISLPAQNDDPISMVRMYGPDPELISPQSIETCKMMLQWKAKLHQAQLKQIERLKQRWMAERQDVENRIEAINEEIKGVGSSASINRNLIQELTNHKMNLEVSVRGLEARAQAGKISLESAKQEAEKNKANNSEEALLHRALENRMVYLDRVQQLRQQDAASDEDVAAAEIAVLEQQLKLEQFRQRLQEKSAVVQQLEADLAASMTELTSLQHQLVKVTDQLEKVGAVVDRIEQLQARQQFIQSIVQRCDAQSAELEIENARDAALMKLVEEALGDDPSDD